MILNTVQYSSFVFSHSQFIWQLCQSVWRKTDAFIAIISCHPVSLKVLSRSSDMLAWKHFYWRFNHVFYCKLSWCTTRVTWNDICEPSASQTGWLQTCQPEICLVFREWLLRSHQACCISMKTTTSTGHSSSLLWSPCSVHNRSQ